MRPPAPGILPSPPILRLDPAGSERDQLGHGPEVELLEVELLFVFDARAMGFNGLCA